MERQAHVHSDARLRARLRPGTEPKAGFKSLKIASASTQSDRLLAASYDRVGDLEDTQEHLPEAMTSYQSSLAITERLAKSDPGNADWQRGLSVLYAKVGNMQMAQGHLPEALISCQASFAIIDRLAKSDPRNADWQRELSVSYEKIGNVQVAQGHLPEAMISYQADFAISDRLAKSDPGNAGWQSDLSVSYNSVGHVQVEQGHLPEAMTSYQSSLAIRDRLAKSDPGNASWKRDMQSTTTELGSLSYHFLLRSEFAKALEAVDLAISRSPDEIWLYANRAHALMFLDRTEEARALYLQYRGEKNVQDGKPWTTQILEDFAELRKAELSRPLMREVEKQFKR